MECPSQPSSAFLTLKSDLMCNYDTTVLPPSVHSNTTTIYVRLVLHFMQFRESADLLRLHVWMDLDWKDERLTWDPASYSSVSHIMLDRHALWFPNLVLHTAWRMDETEAMKGNVSCDVRHTGHVSCSAPAVLSTRCQTDAKLWPYDTHQCSLSLGSRVATANEVDVRLHEPPVQLYRYQQSQEWSLFEVSSERHVEPARGDVYPWLEYVVYLERYAKGHFAVVVVPALVLALLTLSSLWVEPGCSERIFVCCSCVAGHVVFMLYAIYVVPTNADNLPLVLRFYVDSFVLASLAMVTSVVTYALAKRNCVPPAYVSRYTNIIANGLVGKFFIPQELKPKENGSEGNEQEIGDVQDGCTYKPQMEWLVIATLVDRAVFFTFISVIVILMHRFIV